MVTVEYEIEIGRGKRVRVEEAKIRCSKVLVEVILMKRSIDGDCNHCRSKTTTQPTLGYEKLDWKVPSVAKIA